MLPFPSWMLGVIALLYPLQSWGGLIEPGDSSGSSPTCWQGAAFGSDSVSPAVGQCCSPTFCKAISLCWLVTVPLFTMVLPGSVFEAALRAMAVRLEGKA